VVKKTLLTFFSLGLLSTSISFGSPFQKKIELGNTYIVKKGDSLWKISQDKHINMTKIKQLNPHIGEKLKIGQIINIDTNAKTSFNPHIKLTQKIANTAKAKLGGKYVWGSMGQNGTFDCSGFTQWVYKKNGFKIPRVSIDQSKHGMKVSKQELQKGDLIFFDTSKNRKGYVNHVGLYLGDGKFIHASSAQKKVVVSSLKEGFYKQRFKNGRRIIPTVEN
jgi:cell wall-associated NlpC family hydrolase